MQKAGTTWLSDRLKSHPRIHPPAIKEPHYFDNLHYWPALYRRLDVKSWPLHPIADIHAALLDNLNYVIANLREAIDAKSDRINGIIEWAQKLLTLRTAPMTPEWYEMIFTGGPAGSITGDFTADTYLLDTEGIEHVLDWNPNAKFLLMLRDPVSRDWSQLRMMYKPGADKPAAEWLERPEFVGRSSYEEILSRWEKTVPAGQLHIDFFDHIKTTPKALLDRVSTFLGVEPLGDAWDNTDQVEFPGPKVTLDADLRRALIQHNDRALTYLAERFPLCGKWRDRYR